MTKIKKLFLFVFAGTLLFSCKKEGDTIYEPADEISSYRVTESISYEGGLLPTSKSTYQYEGDKLVLKEMYDYNISEWEKKSELKFSYDGDKVVTEGYYADDTTGVPKIVVETIIENGKAVEISKYEYEDGVKTLTIKHVNKYDGDNLIEFLVFDNIYDNSGSTYIIDTINYHKYFYRGDTLVKDEYRYRYGIGYGWTFSDSTIYSYENGKEIRTSYELNNNAWELSSKVEYSLPTDGFRNSYFYDWDEIQEAWVQSGTTTYTVSFSKDAKRVELLSDIGWTGEYSTTTNYEPGVGNADLFPNSWIYGF